MPDRHIGGSDRRKKWKHQKYSKFLCRGATGDFLWKFTLKKNCLPFKPIFNSTSRSINSARHAVDYRDTKNVPNVILGEQPGIFCIKFIRQ
jgi:hypothetical protein